MFIEVTTGSVYYEWTIKSILDRKISLPNSSGSAQYIKVFLGIDFSIFFWHKF